MRDRYTGLHRLLNNGDFLLMSASTTTLRSRQNFDHFIVVTSAKHSFKTTSYLKSVYQSGDTGSSLTYERFDKTIFQELYQVTFLKKLYSDLESLQMGLDNWLWHYNKERTHQGENVLRACTPMATLLDGKRVWAEKI